MKKPNWEKEVKKFFKTKYAAQAFVLDILREALKEQREEMKRLKELAEKYAKVISLCYDGEDVEEAERKVGLRK